MHNHSNGNELRILMQIKLISLTIAEHQDSLRNRDKQQLGNGPLIIVNSSEFTIIVNLEDWKLEIDYRKWSSLFEKTTQVYGHRTRTWEC